MTQRRLSAWLVVPLFLLSGAASLVYEVIWSRLLVHVMGGTTFAITTVLVAFMGGLALGAAISGRFVGRIRQPQRVYGVLEILIGVYALATPWLMDLAVPFYRMLYEQSGQHFWLLLVARFGVSCAFMLIPTTMMGATLPLLVQYMTVGRSRAGAPVAVLYAVNTFGAVLGSASAGFLAIPILGLTRSTFVAAALNFVVGVFVWMLPRAVEHAGGEAPAPARAAKPVAPPELDTTRGMGRQLILWTFALSGACAMLYQVCWVRALIMAIGPHTYGFTTILVAYIFGIGMGSLAVAPLVDRWKRPMLVFGMMELGIAASCLITVPYFGRMPEYVFDVVQISEGSFNTVLKYEFLIVLALVFVPTFLMGAIFPLVNRLCARYADDVGRTVGTAYAWNTFGTIVGTIVAGFILIPSASIGVRWTILIGVAFSALIALAVTVASARARLGTAHLATGALCLAVLGAIPFIPRWDVALLNASAFWDSIHVTKRHAVVYFREGVDASIAVTEDEDREIRTLKVNSKGEANNSVAMGMPHIGFPHLAVASAPNVDKLCLIGLGSGLSLGAPATHSEIERIDCVEISAGVIEAARRFFGEYNHFAIENPRVNMIRADGRNHLLLTREKYDVVLSMASNPWTAGVANLFTQEFFELCKERLTPDGRLCMWLQVYPMAERDFQSIIHTATTVFPFVTLWRGYANEFLIIAAPEPFKIPVSRFKGLYAETAVREDLARIGYLEPYVLAGSLIAGGEPLAKWAAPAPINTDDNAYIEFSSPTGLFGEQRAASRVLTSLLREAFMPVEEMIAYDPAVAEELLFVQAARRGQEAARLYVEATEASWTNRYADAVRACVAARDKFPENPFYTYLLRSTVGMAQQTAISLRDRELARLCASVAKKLMEEEKPPTILPRTPRPDFGF